MKDCILGIDSSTTATKVVAWSQNGENLGEGRCPIPMDMPAMGRYEQNPKDWWASLVSSLSDLGDKFDLRRIVALAVSNQRETVAFLSAEGEPVSPAIIWLDERCRSVVDEFADKVGADSIHRITGKHKDITPVVYRLAWMRKNMPDICDNVEVISDVQAFLVKCLTGSFVTSWASADPMGCWDIANKCWSDEILSLLGWSDAVFPPAKKPGTLLGTLSAQAAKQTGLTEGMPVIAGGGDGQCAGLAVGVTRSGTAYINIGTAVVCGAHQTHYAFGKAWRTMTSMSGEGYIMESCLRSGTFLLNWLVGDIYGCPDDTEEFVALEKNAARLPAGSDGVSVLPYWSGVMNPHWDTAARGAIFGLAGNHGRAHLYRAVMEGISLDQADCMKAIEQNTGVKIKRYFAVGGGAQSDLWCQIFADCLGCPVFRMDTVEASALGAGMSAAAGVGMYDSLTESSDKMRGRTNAQFSPGENASDYAHLLGKYATLYPAVKTSLC